MKMSGNRGAWIGACASIIMDGGNPPPSIERLCLLVPGRVGTSVNDGHVTAAIVFGEEQRKDYRAGQRHIISEVVEVLREQGFVGGDNDALHWLKPLDGEFQVEVDGHAYTIYGQRERRLSGERAMLGERHEETGDLIGMPGRFASGTSEPFKLDVIGPRGGHEEMSVTVHPFALAIPPMTEAEREGLRASIERDGVKVPIVIYQKKILDGRHRGYFASILKKPVRIDVFEGSEDEAKRLVATLNLRRRHLSIAQQAAVLILMFGEDVRKETAKNKIRKPESVVPKSGAQILRGHEGKWAGRLAQKGRELGMPNVTRHAIESIQEVKTIAPNVFEKIVSGEIKEVAEANKIARAEKKLPPAKLPKDIDNRSIVRRLGRCIDELSKILGDCDAEMPVGQVPEMISPRLDEIERLTSRVRLALCMRNIIPWTKSGGR